MRIERSGRFIYPVMFGLYFFLTLGSLFTIKWAIGLGIVATTAAVVHVTRIK
ncbi:MAG: hypothetical protein V1845_01685 [bacterium]